MIHHYRGPAEYKLTIRTSTNSNPILVLSKIIKGEEKESWWNAEKISNAITRSTLSKTKKSELFLEGIDLVEKNYTSEFHKEKAIKPLQDGLNSLEIKKYTPDKSGVTFGDLLRAKNFSFGSIAN